MTKLRLLVLLLFALPAFAQQGELANKQIGFPQPNDTSTGTVLHGTAIVTTSATAIVATTANTSLPAYIVVGNAGTSGNASLSTNGFLAQCTMDATATNTGGFYVINSTTTNGRCHAQAAQPASGVWIIGFMHDSSTAIGGQANITVNGQFVSTGGGGGGGVTSFNGRSGPVISAVGDYTFSQISGSAVNSQLPGSGIININSTACTLGSTCTVGGTTTINTIPCLLGSSCTIPTGGLPTLPTAPNSVPETIQSTPSGGIGGAAVWALYGMTTRAVTGATSTDTILNTDCTNRVIYSGSVAVAAALPTPTTFQVPSCVFKIANFTSGVNTKVRVTPTTLTIGPNATSFYDIPQNQWCTLTQNSTNWDLDCGGTGIPQVLDGRVFGATTAGVQACIAASLADNLFCDERELGSITFPVEIDLGNSANNFGGLLLGMNASWSSTVTNGTSDGFKLFPNFTVIGPGFMPNALVFKPLNSSTSIAHIFETSGQSGYYSAQGFNIANTTGTATTSGIGVLLNGLVDGSTIGNITLDDYTDIPLQISQDCCNVVFPNWIIFGNNTSNGLLDIEYTGTGTSNYGITFPWISAGHSSAATNPFTIHSTTGFGKNDVHFGTVFSESNPSASVDCWLINGNNFLLVDYLEGCITTAAVYKNASGSSLLSLGAMHIANGTLPTVVLNDVVNSFTLSTDANGFFPGYRSGISYFGSVDGVTSLLVGPTPPACTAGTAFFICGNEGTAFTNVSAAAGFYFDSTSHEMVEKTAGASGGGMVLRAHPGSIHLTAQTGSIATATLCAAAAGACNVAGQYHIHLDLINTGTACGTIGSGSVAPTITWTDTNGTSHAAVPFPMETNASATALATSFVPTVSALTAWASGDMNISTNGSVIQYATTLTACGAGTLTYQIDASVTRMQ